VEKVEKLQNLGG